MPSARLGGVRVRVLASGIEYTDIVIRRHVYTQTMFLRPPFVMGYDVVGEIDQLGNDVSGFQIGDRVADLTVVGSNATYRTLRAKDVARSAQTADALPELAMARIRAALMRYSRIQCARSSVISRLTSFVLGSLAWRTTCAPLESVYRARSTPRPSCEPIDWPARQARRALAFFTAAADRTLMLCDLRSLRNIARHPAMGNKNAEQAEALRRLA
jgi:hypothetical protein